jgi:hypothetical protein
MATDEEALRECGGIKQKAAKAFKLEPRRVNQEAKEIAKLCNEEKIADSLYYSDDFPLSHGALMSF